MNMHESVAWCERCDWAVANCEMTSCEECGAPICPGCRIVLVKDKNLFACSHKCRAKQDVDFIRARRRLEAEAAEAKLWAGSQTAPRTVQ